MCEPACARVCGGVQLCLTPLQCMPRASSMTLEIFSEISSLVRRYRTCVWREEIKGHSPHSHSHSHCHCHPHAHAYAHNP